MSARSTQETKTSRMTRRGFLDRAGRLGLAATLAGPLTRGVGAAAADRPGRRPNVLFILTDDQRWDMMSCAGHEVLHTPHMDRLAAEGTRFENAFVTNSLCAPARATCLTGRYSHSHDVFTNPGPRAETMQVPGDIATFPELFQDAGYHTRLIGKWHLSNFRHPRGFDRWVSIPGQGDYYNPQLIFDGSEKKVPGYTTDLLTDYAIDFVNSPPADRPWMLYLSYKAPHLPYDPHDRYLEPFKNHTFELPETYDDSREGEPPWRAEMRKAGWSDRHVGPDRIQRTLRGYHGLVKGIDVNLGRLWKALERTGQWENTVIVFIGDNGHMLGENGLFQKMRMYEPSIRVPLIVRDPRRAAGRVRSEMALNNDVMPTLLDAAGLPIPQSVQGRSLLPLLDDSQPAEWRDAFLYEHLHTRHLSPMVRGVRTERWKYTEYYVPGEFVELFDLRSDPNERRNLADDPAHAETRGRLRQRMLALWKETGGGDIAEYIPAARGEWRRKYGRIERRLERQ